MEETKTKYPGVYRIDRGYRVRAYFKDPRTGKTKEVVKTLEGASIQEALKARGALREELKTGPQFRAERMTLSVYARRWLEEHAGRDRFSTLHGRVQILESYVLPALGNVFLDELTPLTVKDWIKDMAGRTSKRGKPYSPSTINDWLRVVRAMVREAVVDLNLPRDPTLGVRALPHGQVGDDGGNVLTAEELRDFLSAARKTAPDHYAMILVGLTTGMRFGELSALRWEDVDLDHGMVMIRRSQVRGRVALPKTGKLRRVPVSEAVVATLREHHESLGEADLVFPGRKGGHHATCFLAKAFKRVAKEAGIKKRFTPHGMRRTFNTLMVEAGVDRVVLWATIGHSSERMTEHYSHVGDAARRQVTDQVTKLLNLPIGSKTGVGEVAIV